MWSLLLVDNEQPEVEIVTSDRVHKRSLPVVYYVAGWTLQRASLLKTVASSDRKTNQLFATLDSIGRESAKEEGVCPLPWLKCARRSVCSLRRSPILVLSKQLDQFI